MAFQVLLISAATLLALGKANDANEAAVDAFYALVIGVAIQAWVAVGEEMKHTSSGSDDRSQPS